MYSIDMPNSRYRGLRPHPEALGVTPLAKGEISRPVRIRASETVHNWLKGMNAGELGQLLASIMNSGDLTMRNAQDEKSSRPIRELPAGVTLLRVTAPTVPQGLKNRLRWPPDRYADLEEVLTQTKAVRLDVNNGKTVWRIDDGQPMRKNTVLRLYGAGVLAAD